ncbi:MAG: hypothetical protein RB191_04890 [Terriglobia bacterium]|nr:hypothetical protein [Terriglobia bacterium]
MIGIIHHRVIDLDRIKLIHRFLTHSQDVTRTKNKGSSVYKMFTFHVDM